MWFAFSVQIYNNVLTIVTKRLKIYKAFVEKDFQDIDNFYVKNPGYLHMPVHKKRTR